MRHSIVRGGLAVVVLLAGCGEGEARPTSPQPASAQGAAPPPSALRARPAAGALAFGATQAAVEKLLGPGTNPQEVQGVSLRTYAVEGAELLLGFYRDMLAGVVITPKAPWEWLAAEAWTRVFLPGFQPQNLSKRDPACWSYFEEIRVRELPFEAGFTFTRNEAGQVTRIEGKINWLD